MDPGGRDFGGKSSRDKPRRSRVQTSGLSKVVILVGSLYMYYIYIYTKRMLAIGAVERCRVQSFSE